MKFFDSSILTLFKDRELYERLSEEGISMVKDKFNWEAQEEKLLGTYETILKAG